MKQLNNSDLIRGSIVGGKIIHYWDNRGKGIRGLSLCGLRKYGIQLSSPIASRVCKKCAHSLEIRTPSQDDAGKAQSN